MQRIYLFERQATCSAVRNGCAATATQTAAATAAAAAAATATATAAQTAAAAATATAAQPNHPQPQPQPQPQPKTQPLPQKFVDQGQDSLDLSMPTKMEGVSSLSDLLPFETDVDPHVIQKKKIEAFNIKKEIDAKRLEKKARVSSEQNVKSNLVSRAQELQKQREASDIARDRSRPKIPESASRTLKRR